MTGETVPADVETRPQPSPRRLPAVDWLLVLYAILLIGYWLYVLLLERIDGQMVLATYFPGITDNPWLTPVFVLAEAFNWRVLRHFVPVVLGIWLGYEAAVTLMYALYEMRDRSEARRFLWRQVIGGASGATISLSADTLEDVRRQTAQLRVGGPVTVNVPVGYAGVVERNGRLARVVPFGSVLLGRFEYLHALINLRALDKVARDIQALSKEGIPVTVDMGLAFQISPGTQAEDTPPTAPRQSTPDEPYPFQEDAVSRAAYVAFVLANGRVSNWTDAPIGRARGVLINLIAEYPLDQLVAAESPVAVHDTLTRAVSERVRQPLLRDGILPLRLRIGRVTPPPEVSRQLTDYWLAQQRRQDAVAQANGTAAIVYDAELAHAEAEVAMINAIAEGVRLAQQEAGTKVSGYILALRLVEALERLIKRSSGSLATHADEADSLVGQINQLGSQLSRLESRLEPPVAGGESTPAA